METKKYNPLSQDVFNIKSFLDSPGMSFTLIRFSKGLSIMNHGFKI